jgi:hypothetical protein
VNDVLDGGEELDEFMFAYLRWKTAKQNKAGQK